uniref:basic proline-rich protein-like n=1 Tax=Nyctereutes procyonoides TaxID=34880 RepID=UPI002443DAF0|nr:basic proline-rich protein-like [Nyctereutes procyonoides]
MGRGAGGQAGCGPGCGDGGRGQVGCRPQRGVPRPSALRGAPSASAPARLPACPPARPPRAGLVRPGPPSSAGLAAAPAPVAPLDSAVPAPALRGQVARGSLTCRGLFSARRGRPSAREAGQGRGAAAAGAPGALAGAQDPGLPPPRASSPPPPPAPARPRSRSAGSGRGPRRLSVGGVARSECGRRARARARALRERGEDAPREPPAERRAEVGPRDPGRGLAGAGVGGSGGTSLPGGWRTRGEVRGKRKTTKHPQMEVSLPLYLTLAISPRFPSQTRAHLGPAGGNPSARGPGTSPPSWNVELTQIGVCLLLFCSLWLVTVPPCEPAPCHPLAPVARPVLPTPLELASPGAGREGPVSPRRRSKASAWGREGRDAAKHRGGEEEGGWREEGQSALEADAAARPERWGPPAGVTRGAAELRCRAPPPASPRRSRRPASRAPPRLAPPKPPTRQPRRLPPRLAPPKPPTRRPASRRPAPPRPAEAADPPRLAPASPCRSRRPASRAPPRLAPPKPPTRPASPPPR